MKRVRTFIAQFTRALVFIGRGSNLLAVVAMTFFLIRCVGAIELLLICSVDWNLSIGKGERSLFIILSSTAALHAAKPWNSGINSEEAV